MGPSVRLRLLAEDDLATTLDWRNQERIRMWFFDARVISPEQHRAWFEEYRGKEDDFVFVIEERGSGGPVGQVSLYHVDGVGRRAEYGRLMIGERAAQGRGLAREATDLLVRWALGPLGLEEVHLEVLQDNVGARRLYERSGFVTTGRREGVVLMAIRGVPSAPG